MMSRCVVLAIACVICSGGLARANLLTNGDFESPGAILSQVQMTNTTGNTPTGWTHSGSGVDYYSPSNYFDITAKLAEILHSIRSGRHEWRHVEPDLRDCGHHNLSGHLLGGGAAECGFIRR